MDIKLYSEKKFAPRKIEIEGINKTRLDALKVGQRVGELRFVLLMEVNLWL